jgi:hypothetical protein
MTWRVTFSGYKQVTEGYMVTGIFTYFFYPQFNADLISKLFFTPSYDF